MGTIRCDVGGANQFRARRVRQVGNAQRSEEHAAQGSQVSSDIIKNKGLGCIFLCHGPPGTGKTLTAESIAENLKLPLWSVSMTELGTTSDVLEEALGKLLQVAQNWGAIVLLDEADVYLKRRDNSDLNRNAMVAAFLKLVEYFSGNVHFICIDSIDSTSITRMGILFLTTNRVAHFDDAMCSRVNVFLKFAPLDPTDREKIWLNFVKQHNDNRKDGESSILEKSASEFAQESMNGREIRNVMHMAKAWARGSKEPLAEHHIKKAIATTMTMRSENLPKPSVFTS
ncbi:P-loop containing nucleoside triphosphate hydrolase protein [Jimgerdemannia flammicorona]|uniref:P-loop containing nucleoside triphosphate hydrolase protein n=1 Tax=Jimgerdemannia flammicorona TaxID=994334 RepID=A0A433DAY7_9FUNG|nr:P-loop containing nucleoside triphosphate hydrolase protein [Jimgerdemannia flammicorona]